MLVMSSSARVALERLHVGVLFGRPQGVVQCRWKSAVRGILDMHQIKIL